MSFLSKGLICSLVALAPMTVAGIVFAPEASAVGIFNYTINGSFSDGGTFGGSFTYDSDTFSYTNYSIETTAGTILTTPFTYDGTSAPDAGGTPTQLTLFSATPLPSRTTTLIFAQSLANGGSIGIAGGTEQIFSSPGFPVRVVSSGSVVGTPVPLDADSVPLVLAGLGLGGGLLLKRKLQQKKVAESLAVIQSPELKSVQG
jgi:hypothetical protein